MILAVVVKTRVMWPGAVFDKAFVGALRNLFATNLLALRLHPRPKQ